MSERLLTAAATRRRRRGVGAAASVGLHAIVLAWLGWTAPPRLPERPDAPSPPVLILRLERPSRQAKSIAAATTAEGSPSTAPGSKAVLVRKPVARPTATVPSPLAAARPTTSPPAGATAAGAGAHPGPMPAGESGADLRGFLRATVGCAHEDYMRLTAAERTRCDKGFGEAARTAPHFDPVPAEKRAYYDAAVEAHRSARGMETAVAPNHIGKGPKGLDVGGGVHPRCFGVRPTNAIHIPGTRCWIVPQRGVLTEELGLSDPASLRERTDDAGHAARFDPPKP